MDTLTKVGLAAVLVTMVCATNISFASPNNQEQFETIRKQLPPSASQFQTINRRPTPPAKQFESTKKQPPPPIPTELKKQIPGQISSAQIKRGPIPDIGEKFSCSADVPGCTPGGSGSGGKPGGGEQPPDCSEVGPNEPCG